MQKKKEKKKKRSSGARGLIRFTLQLSHTPPPSKVVERDTHKVGPACASMVDAYECVLHYCPFGLASRQRQRPRLAISAETRTFRAAWFFVFFRGPSSLPSLPTKHPSTDPHFLHFGDLSLCRCRCRCQEGTTQPLVRQEEEHQSACTSLPARLATPAAAKAPKAPN